MLRRTRKKRIWIPFVCFILPLYIGCDKSDYSKYKSARQAATDTTKESPSAETAEEEVHDSVEPTTPLTFTESDLPPVSALIPVNVVDGASIRSILTGPTQDNTSGSTPADQPAKDGTPPAVPVGPRKIELLVKERSFKTDRKTTALLVTFEDLDMEKVLNMTEVTEQARDLMPDWLTGLRGKTIRIRGFMVPTYVAEGIELFVLARDNQACCFGPNPKIDYLAQVTMKANKTTNYIPATRAFDVVGRFNIDIQADKGKLYQMYFIDDAEIIER